MQIVVSCDYLISPAFCDPQSLAEKVGDLVAIKRELECGGTRVVLEADALTKLTELNYYPCAPLFNSNIPRELRGEFSAKDISKVVHNIASMVVDDECLLPESIAEWSSKVFDPTLQGSNHTRAEALLHLVEDVFLAGYLHHRPYSILHHPLSSGTNAINVSGEITHSIPEFDSPPPLELHDQIKIFATYNNFLCLFNASELYLNAQTLEQVYEALVLGATSLIQVSQAGTLRNFSLGESFIDSLHAHQCAPGQKFSGTAFEVICHVIASIPKYPHNPMYSDINKHEQKKRGDALAWRTQITKGNPALRLMYWTTDNNIELANIGNKKDLKIF